MVVTGESHVNDLSPLFAIRNLAFALIMGLELNK